MPKIRDVDDLKTPPNSPHAKETRARRPLQEQRTCPDLTPTSTCPPQLQPGYPAYFTGAQYAPVVVHMPPLVVHVQVAPQLPPQLQLQLAPTPTPTITHAISRPHPDAHCFACMQRQTTSHVQGSRPWGSLQLLWMNPAYPPVPPIPPTSPACPVRTTIQFFVEFRDRVAGDFL